MVKVLSAQMIKKILPDATIRSGTIIYSNTKIGKRFMTGHNVVIREDNIIGDNVVVGVNTYLGPNNKIGKCVKIHTGCFVEGAVIEDNVIVAPHVVFTNDPYPPCHKCVEKVGGARIGKNTVIGANSTILPGIKIGKNCLIGAGSVVTKDMEDNAVVVGNPAKKIKDIKDISHKH